MSTATAMRAEDMQDLLIVIAQNWFKRRMWGRQGKLFKNSVYKATLRFTDCLLNLLMAGRKYWLVYNRILSLILVTVICSNNDNKCSAVRTMQQFFSKLQLYNYILLLCVLLKSVITDKGARFIVSCVPLQQASNKIHLRWGSCQIKK